MNSPKNRLSTTKNKQRVVFINRPEAIAQKPAQ